MSEMEGTAIIIFVISPALFGAIDLHSSNFSELGSICPREFTFSELSKGIAGSAAASAHL
jgi:hypothetical protein